MNTLHGRWLNGREKKNWRQLHHNAASNFEQILEARPHKAAAVQPPTSHHENMQDSDGEAGTSS